MHKIANHLPINPGGVAEISRGYHPRNNPQQKSAANSEAARSANQNCGPSECENSTLKTQNSKLVSNSSSLAACHSSLSSSFPSLTSVKKAETIAAACRQFLALTADGSLSIRQAAALLNKPANWFSGSDCNLIRFQRDGLSGLIPQRQSSIVNRKFQVPDWFVPAARFFYLISNRRRQGGSVPEAIRRVIDLPNFPAGWSPQHKQRFLKAISASLCLCASVANEIPVCPPGLRSKILEREKNGQNLVPVRIARLIAVNRAIVHRHRSPRAWSLDTLCAPGSQRRYLNAATGRREIMLPGDWFGGDDATPGIAVCVGLGRDEGGQLSGGAANLASSFCTPCSQKFGVLLGRFQWLAFHDCRTDKILAWDYVIRPRGSYRAEDILHGMGAVTRAHGIPRIGWQFEGGIWNSKLVRQAIELMGCQHWRTWSPHPKSIEAIFNRVWTRLSVQFPNADMGRYRNENEANCKLYEECKRGHRDPRQFFPPIHAVIKAFEEEVAAHNAKRIFSTQYGQWVPDELFDLYCRRRGDESLNRESLSSSSFNTVAVTQSPLCLGASVANPLRLFSPEMNWIFSPFACERKIQKMLVRCRVPMFENFSVPFEFNAPWMPLHSGKLVRIHFNPREPRCEAMIVLLENSGAHRAGEILGPAQLIGETAGHIRLVMSWARDDQRAGYIARQRTAHFVRRAARAIGPLGRVTYSHDDQHNGISTSTVITREASGVRALERRSFAVDHTAENKPASTLQCSSASSPEGCGKLAGDNIPGERTMTSRPEGAPENNSSHITRHSSLRELETFERTHQHLLV